MAITVTGLSYARALKYLYMGSPQESSYFLNFYASRSTWTTVAHTTTWWPNDIVDIEGSTVFYTNINAAFRRTSKADLLGLFTFFHCRMMIIQPAWKVCTTVEFTHFYCRHLCSCSSHKTIPSDRELVVTQFLRMGCFVTALSIWITQFVVIDTRIGYKVK